MCLAFVTLYTHTHTQILPQNMRLGFPRVSGLVAGR